MLRDHAELYWAVKRHRNPTISTDFCAFFARMVSFDPLLHPTISQILADPWLQGPQVSPEYIQSLLIAN